MVDPRLQRWRREIDLAVRNGRPLPWPVQVESTPEISRREYQAWELETRQHIERRELFRIQTHRQWLEAQRHKSPTREQLWEAVTAHRLTPQEEEL